MLDSGRLDILASAVREAGRYAAAAQSRVHRSFKDDGSVLTEADTAISHRITRTIRELFPEAAVISEEEETENRSRDWIFILDPIDGTKSFISGVPLFGTLIGLMRAGEPILGLIDQPILKERIVGDNIECLFNGKPVKTSDRKEAKGATLLTSDSRNNYKCHSAAGWRALEDLAGISRTWGDCYGYMLLCRGLAHIMSDALLEVWDFTALLPALRGAGAAYSDWRGGSEIGNRHGLVACCTPELHSEVIKTLNPDGDIFAC